MLQIVNKNQTYTLIFSESVLLYSKNDTVIITFPFDGANRTFHFNFTNKPDVPQYNIAWEISPPPDGNTVRVELNKWASGTYVENTSPVEFLETSTKSKLHIKLRVTMSETSNDDFCKLEISIFSSKT